MSERMNDRMSDQLTGKIGSDFDHQLDYLLETCEGTRQAMHMMIWQIWKLQPDLVRLTVTDESSMQWAMLGMPSNKPKLVTDAGEAFKAIQQMDFEKSLDYLKHIRAVRSL